MHCELDVLSEQYIQKCLQLSSGQQNSNSRETMPGCKERELEQLRRENQVNVHFNLNAHCTSAQSLHVSTKCLITLFPGAED